MNTIPEKDWKALRRMQDAKLALLCEEILAKAENISKQRKGNEHQSFLRLWDEVNKGNAEVAALFDDIRRSNALAKVMAWKRRGLLNGDDVGAFSAETQRFLKRV